MLLQPPILPEPITVPGNVADGDYNLRIRFLRTVGVAHILSVVAFGACTYFWLWQDGIAAISRIGTDALYTSAAACVVLLCASRRWPTFAQLIVLACVFTTLSGALAMWLALMSETFPIFVSSGVMIIALLAVVMFLYNVCCGRDYSFLGQFSIVFLCIFLATVTFSILNPELSFGEGVTILLGCLIILYYWVYDLSMVVRRRTAAQPLEAVVDLYRDVFNFVGYPVRVLRMKNRRGRMAA